MAALSWHHFANWLWTPGGLQHCLQYICSCINGTRQNCIHCIQLIRTHGSQLEALSTVHMLTALPDAAQGLMHAVEMELASRLSKPAEAATFSRQHLANSLWALATLEKAPSPRLLVALADAMKERVSDCNPQEISNTVWAFAKLGRLLRQLRCCSCLHPSARFSCHTQQYGVMLHSVPSGSKKLSTLC